MTLNATVWIPVGLLTGFLLGWLFRQLVGQRKLAKATKFAKEIVEDAKSQAETLKREKLLELKEEEFQGKQKLEKEAKNKQHELTRREKQLASRELNLDRKVDILNKKERQMNRLNQELKDKEDDIRKKDYELEKLIQEQNTKLEQISGLTSDEAKKLQMQNMLDQVRRETAQEVNEMREQAKLMANREAKEVIIQALQRSSVNHIVDTTVSIIKLPDDEMKGRIIGREGRNIRSFESATGIEVLIDDTPQTVTLSGFDPVRREIAKQAMEKLVSDGRIHPGRIEEVVEKCQTEIHNRIFEIGEQALHEFGLHGIHTELKRLLGKQYFRTSHGQNLLQHSKEVATLAGGMASQLGLDMTQAQRAGILHDIGKCAEDYGEAPFHEIGRELAKKFGENEVVQNAIEAQAPMSNNGNLEIVSPITILVQVANSVSISRPGAQKEMLENYIKRMRSLEGIATTYSGVRRAYAIQAGREIRVMVEHTIIDDAKAQVLADDIVKNINKNVEHSGQIKVAVIREYRSVDFAK
ncbi:ribonuclease Y [bacterium]|nr:ribonuclease Y [bacterium]